MTKFLKTHGTTFTFALFLVSTVSGVFLFFHIASSTFHAMHEWLSMALLIPVAIHMWRNWASFLTYFKRKTMVIPLVLSLVAGAVFAYPSLTSTSRNGSPIQMTMRAMLSGSIAQVAPLYKLTPEALAERLSKKGYVVSSASQSLREVAEASGKRAGPGFMADVVFP